MIGRGLIRGAMVAIFPGGSGLPGIVECDLDGFLDRFFQEAALALKLGLVAGAVLYQLSPLLTVGLPVPAFLLSEAQRERHLNRLLSHPIYLLRQACFLLKTVAGLCWGSHPSVRALYALPPYPPDPGSCRST